MTVAPTSILSFWQIRNTLAERQKAVADLLRDRNLTNREIAGLLGWEINTVTPRVKELRDRGLVYKYGQKRDEQTQKTATVWAMRDEYRGRQDSFNF